MNSTSQLSLTPPRVEPTTDRRGERDARNAPPPLFQAFANARASSSAARARRVPQYVALATLAVVFVCALYFAIANWRGIDRQTNADSRWRPFTCNVTEDVQATPLEGSESRYRVFADVQFRSDEDERRAFYGRRSTSFTKNDAEKIKNDLNEQREKNNNTLPCFLRDNVMDPSEISLAEITSSSSVYLAWAGTFMAAVIGVILITVCSSSAGSSMGVSALTPMALASPPVAKSVHLTERQAERICARFSDRVPRSAVHDWTCAICLEEDEDGENAPSHDMLHTTVLPCGHRFHGACIKQWLWKGKGLCPLCKWDARKFIAAEKQAGLDGEWDSATTTAASSAVADGSAPLSQSSLALAPSQSPPPPPPPPAVAAVAQTQNVSHVSIDVDQLPDGNGGARR